MFGVTHEDFNHRKNIEERLHPGMLDLVMTLGAFMMFYSISHPISQ